MRKKPRHPYPSRVLATVRRRRLFGPADRVLVALSAGPDSTALVAALAALRDEGEVAEVRAIHVDHGLRPGGAEDAACAAEACARLGVPFESVAVRVAPGNVQAEARRARYAALRAAAARAAATRIATGHTRTDQAETVLLRLLRGAGSRGLSGIPPRRGAIVRPLIDRSRAEGLAFLAATGLRWRDDPTNATPRFARNRLRLDAWPALARLAPALEGALARTADLVRADDRALSRLARRAAPAGGSVPLARLQAEPLAVRRRIVRRLHRDAARGGQLGAAHVDAVLALTRRGRPGRVALPGGVEARCRYGALEIAAAGAEPGAPEPEPVRVGGPGRYVVPGRALAIAVEAVDGATPAWPLWLRARRPGDRFRPAGGRGSKKLKAWLIDRKIPRERRGALVVLADAAGAVLAIPELGAVAEGAGVRARVADDA